MLTVDMGEGCLSLVFILKNTSAQSLLMLLNITSAADNNPRL